jgi:LysM repeat protein
MKFSHALIVVLALHIIAVEGLCLQLDQGGHSPSSKLQTKDENAPSAAQAAAEPKPSPARQAPEARPERPTPCKPADTLSRTSRSLIDVEAIEKENGITSYSMIRVGQVLRIPAASAQKGSLQSHRPIRSRQLPRMPFSRPGPTSQIRPRRPLRTPQIRLRPSPQRRKSQNQPQLLPRRTPPRRTQ